MTQWAETALRDNYEASRRKAGEIGGKLFASHLFSKTTSLSPREVDLERSKVPWSGLTRPFATMSVQPSLPKSTSTRSERVRDDKPLVVARQSQERFETVSSSGAVVVESGWLSARAAGDFKGPLAVPVRA